MGASDLSHVSSGDLLIVDGNRGLVIWSPSEETLEEYRNRCRDDKKHRKKTSGSPAGPCLTEDRVLISHGANIHFSGEVKTAAANGCESIGLYRTEFDFFREGKQPDENSLLDDYSHVLKTAKGAPVTFRTIDVGIDQKTWEGVNLNLGARGLRFCLENKDVFKKQLRALYRASTSGPMRILLPFVSTIDDLDAAREVLAEVRGELDLRRQPYDSGVPLGVMIETPAAAQTCDLMASHVDFFCLGTNDLISITCNRPVRPIRDAFVQPVPSSHSPMPSAGVHFAPADRETYSSGGEMAADPPSAAVLLAGGFTSLSVNLAAYPRIRRMIRSVSFDSCGNGRANIENAKPNEVEEKVRATVYRT
jgi:phosphotransferase system enzyme I (PtsI)